MEPGQTRKLGRGPTDDEVAAQQAARRRMGLPPGFGPPPNLISAIEGPEPPDGVTGILDPHPEVDIEGVTSGTFAPDSVDAPRRAWEKATRDTLGIRAIDPVAHRIGPFIANRYHFGLDFIGKNWYPMSEYKQVLVGKLEQYGVYNGVGAEWDWNLFIRPSEAFEFIRDDAIVYADLGEVHRAPDGTVWVEAEITPDQSFYDNPYFERPKIVSTSPFVVTSITSPLVGTEIGVYGPWVLEEAHGFRPEIHPCQLIWWRNIVDGMATYHVITMQDDSNRFDKQEHFAGDIPRPWAKPPISGRFAIAVRVPRGQGRRYLVEELEHRRVVRPASVDQTETIEQVVGDSSRVTVDLSLAHVRNVGVQIGSFWSQEDANEERGFITLRTQVGVDSDGGEGYQVLRITESAS